MKYLVLNLIGFLDDEDQNLKGIGHKILNDDSLKVAFMKSIMTQKWINFLVSDIDLELNIVPLQNAIYHIVHTNGKKFPDQVIDLLIKYEDQLDNDKVVNCLRSCVNVTNKKFLTLFSDNKKQILEWEFLMSSILKSAIEAQEYDFVVDQLSSYYKSIKDYNIEPKRYFSTTYHQVLENLWKKSSQNAYQATKILFIDICENSRYKIQIGKYVKTEAYSDFYGIEKDDREHKHLYTWLLDHLSQLQDPDTLSKELDDFLKLEFDICMCLVIEVIVKRPEILSIKGYSLLFDFLPDFNDDGSLLQYLTSRMINSIYPYINTEDQYSIYLACMSVPDWFVREWYGVKRRNRRLYESRYKLISSIPIDSLLMYPERKGKLQEFQRRFGSFEWKRPKGIECTVSSGSIPLPEKAYTSMALDELQDSFIKIDQGLKYHRHVTVYGHAEAFQKQCKDFPSKYYGFVQQLIRDASQNKINPIYTCSGIMGLLESNLPTALAIEIVHSAIDKEEFYSSESYRLTRMISHFTRSNKLTEKMVDYIIQKAMKISTEDDESHFHILDELFCILYIDEYSERIFNAVETLSYGRNEKLNLSLLGYLARLNFFDMNRAVIIFHRLMVNFSSLEKYEQARGSIQYMVNGDIQLLTPVLLKGILEIEDEKTKEWYGQLVGILWIDEFENSSELYSEAEARSGSFKEGILAISIEIVKERPKNSNAYKRAMENIDKYLCEENENLYNDYQSLIRFITQDNFLEYMPFLEKYMHSKVRETKDRHRTINEKLFELASQFPKECIKLCELDIQSSTFSEQFINSFSDKSIFDVLVKSYNSLSNLYDNDLRICTLDLMDKSLEVAMLNQSHDLTKTFQIFSQNEQD